MTEAKAEGYEESRRALDPPFRSSRACRGTCFETKFLMQGRSTRIRQQACKRQRELAIYGSKYRVESIVKVKLAGSSRHGVRK